MLPHGVAECAGQRREAAVPVECSRAAVRQIAGGELVEFDGADHGFAVPGDDEFLDPRTLRWQGAAIRHVVEWVTWGRAGRVSQLTTWWLSSPRE